MDLYLVSCTAVAGSLSWAPGAAGTASHPSSLPSEESVIQKLVEGLQEVDDELGRQVSAMSSFSVTLVVSLNLAEPQQPLLQNRDNSCLPCAYVENA